MLTVSRRGFLALGGTGAAGVALSACGQTTDRRDDSSPDELKAAEASAETALAQAYSAAASALPKGEERTTLEQFATAAGDRADGLGGGTAQAGDTPDGGPDSAEALDGAIRAADTAIAAHRQAAGLLDEEEGRALASTYLVAVACEVAAVDHFAGKEQSPSPFVTGGDQDPYEAVEDSSTTSTSSTTESSTTSSTKTEGG